MPFPSQEHATKISDRLNVLADQLKTRTRTSLTDANHWLESVMKRFFNALMGWDLVNLNAEQANFPAADLGDKERRIAIQITNQNDPNKITETAAKAAKHELHKDFDRLIIFFLLSEKPSTPKRFSQPPNGPTIECWDLADLLKQMPDLPDQSCLLTALQALEKDLGLSSTETPAYPSNLPGIYSGCLFLGRDAFLRDLRASLLKKTHATAITHTAAATGIAGLGGIGKTHAAVEYARRHLADYTASLFVSGDSPDRLDAGLSALFDTLHLGTPAEVQRDQAVRIAAVKDWFATHRDWLLIVDNVDDEASAAAFTGYLSCLTQGHVLITSRLQNWGRSVEALNIKDLSSEDSTDLLLQLTEGKRRRTEDEAAEARRLADLLEGLPLALHQAAGYISEQRLTFTSYIAEYEAEAASLLDWFQSHIIPYERPDMLARRPVLITWKTSFDKLDADTRFWLLVFAHFSSDPIPEFLLDSAPDAADEVKTRHRAAKRALAQAENYSLLTRDDDPPRFKLHRLVQHILRLTASEADRTVALAMGIQLFDENDLGDPQDVRTWGKWTLLQPHAVSLCANASNSSALGHLGKLLNSLGILFSAKSLYYEAEPLMRLSLEIKMSYLGASHPEIATEMNNLAQLLKATNRLVEAESMMRRALEIAEANFGPNHSNVSRHLHNLGALLQGTNRVAEAEILIRRSLAIDEEYFGPEHPTVAMRLNCLAELLRLTNRLSEAEPLYLQALRIDENSFSSLSPYVARDLNNLALLYLDTDRHAEAEPMLRRSLAIEEQLKGAAHPDVAVVQNSLASLLKATRRSKEAETLIRRSLVIFENSYGIHHPKLGTGLNNLATILQDTGRFAEAEPLMRRALKIDEASYGSEHPDVARDLNNLALSLLFMNRFKEAEPLMQRAYRIFVKSFGANHPHSLTVGRDYMALLQALGVPEEEIEERLRDVVSGALGKSSSVSAGERGVRGGVD